MRREREEKTSRREYKDRRLKKVFYTEEIDEDATV